jgi:transcription elongation GreA/GreB family factor
MAIDEATSPESKAENKYDTRSLESSYLAAGQGARLVELRRLISVLELPDRQFHLVRVGRAAPGRWYLLLPEGGGRRVTVGGDEVTVITPESPLGASLAGAEEGDEVAAGTVWEALRTSHEGGR